MTSKPALLIVNRTSRGGEADLAEGIALLKERGLELIEIVTEDARLIAEIIRNHGDQVDRVILGGGDGTMNAAVEALVESGLPLGILPMGTANDLARTLQIPTVLAEACRVIADGRLHAIDLGHVNNRYFFNAASIGLAVRVTHQLSSEVKKRWGVLGYARSVALAIRYNRAFRARITCDGHTVRVRSIQITVGNGRHYGGGMTVANDAAIDDHLLNLYSIKPQSLWGLLILVPALRWGPDGNQEGLWLMEGQEIEIHTKRPMPITTDGELATHTPAHFRVVPQVLSVYVPSHYPSSTPQA